MYLQAWKTREGCRYSNYHYTFDKAKTLCGKKIPKNPFKLVRGRIEIGNKDCKSCFLLKENLVTVPKTTEEKIARFKKVVEEYGGNYVFDGEHKAYWDDNHGMYTAYGKLSYIGVWLTNNCMYLKINEISESLV